MKHQNPDWDFFHGEVATTDSSPEETEQHLSPRFLSFHHDNSRSPMLHLDPPDINKESVRNLITWIAHPFKDFPPISLTSISLHADEGVVGGDRGREYITHYIFAQKL